MKNHSSRPCGIQLGGFIFGMSCSALSFASDFNLPFVNSSSLGVGYADWATAASDPSTSYTNPAGLAKLDRQQIMFSPLGIFGRAKFTGTSVTPPTPFPAPVIETGTAKSDIGAFAPSLFYSTPVTDRATFGVGITAPFGLGTDYKNSIVRYAATRSQVLATEIDPSVGFKITDIFSVGAGLDITYLSFKIDNKYGPPLSFIDAPLHNNLYGWGLGGHVGVLLDATPLTRVGFSYNSTISIKTDGNSTVFLPTGDELTTRDQRTGAALPARAQLSLQHIITPRWTGMGSVFYTHWRRFRQILMENTMTPFGTTQPVTIPFNYHNTFDYAVGTSFKANERWLLRAGILFMATPSNDHDRGVADPIGSATIPTLGLHYQSSETLSFDLGVGHSFFKQMPIHLTNQLTSLTGHTNTQTTVIGGQVNWAIS